MIFAVLGAVLIGAVDANVRAIQDRVQAGECALSSLKLSSFFPANFRVGELPSTTVESSESDVTAANLISIKYFSNFKVVTEKMAMEQYVLTQCGTTPPTEAEVDAVAALEANYTRKHFTIPLQTVMAESTVQLGLLAALGVEDRVMHLTQYGVSPCFQAAMDCGAKMVDTYAGGTAEELAGQRDGVDAVLMDCSWDGTCGNVNSRANAIHVSASQDPGPLHSAEHVKFLAAFFNKEDSAISHFTSLLQRYESAATTASEKPLVAWVVYNAPSDWGAESYVVSLATYKLHYVTAAGGKNVDAVALMAIGDGVSKVDAPSGTTITLDTATLGGKQAAAAALFQALADVDAVIDETYAWDPAAYTYQNFLENFNLTSDSNLKFISNQMVIRTDGTVSATNALDWYESRLAHPDWAVEGLARQLHGDTSKRAKYFRNLAKGEMPEVLTAAMCANEALPQCIDDAVAQDIPMMVSATDAPTAAPTDAPTVAATPAPTAAATTAATEDASGCTTALRTLPLFIALYSLF